MGMINPATDARFFFAGAVLKNPNDTVQFLNRSGDRLFHLLQFGHQRFGHRSHAQAVASREQKQPALHERPQGWHDHKIG
jgi:hypothetical protein